MTLYGAARKKSHSLIQQQLLKRDFYCVLYFMHFFILDFSLIDMRDAICLVTLLFFSPIECYWIYSMKPNTVDKEAENYCNFIFYHVVYWGTALTLIMTVISIPMYIAIYCCLIVSWFKNFLNMCACTFDFFFKLLYFA